MKEFDLQKAKAGEPLCTRDGRNVRIICWDFKNETYPIVALVENIGKGNVYECANFYHSNGHIYDKGISGTDLMMADIPTTHHEGFVNIRYNMNGRDIIIGSIFPNKDVAEYYCPEEYHTVKMSWEDEV